MTQQMTVSSRRTTAAERMSRLDRRETGLLCLGILFALGCQVLFVDAFVDEGDKLAIALLMLRGMRLYSDVFAHHFPFVFDWLAVIFRLLGPSILVARWSMLAFQLVTFAAVMRLTRLYAPIGMLAILWGGIGHLYWANMVIYQGFAGLSMMAVFILTLTALAGRRCEDRAYWLALGLFSAIAILSDPTMVIGVAVALAALMISRAGRQRVGWSVLVLLAVFIAYAIRLGLDGSLPAFYRDAITFNEQIYSKYGGPTQARLSGVVSSFQHGLHLLDFERWLEPNYGPIVRYSLPERWLFDGLLYRAVFLLLSLTLLMRRRWLAAAFVYTFAAAMLFRADVAFRSLHLALTALAAAIVLITDTAHQHDHARLISVDQRNAVGQAFFAWHWGIRLAVGGLLVWMLALGLWRVADLTRQGGLSYQANFGSLIAVADEVKRLSCGQDVALAFYPGNPYIQFLSGLRSVSRYVFMWPWVAEVALPDVLESLESESQVLVYIDKSVSIWGQWPTRKYLADLISYLDNHYITRGPDYYLSPGLAQQCGAQ
jgi:hypothetical protein